MEPVKGNVLRLKSKPKGPYRTYAVDTVLAPSDIAFEAAPDGHYQLYLHVLSYLYDRGGSLINLQEDQGRVDLSRTEYAKMLRLGVPVNQEISIPVKGHFFLRVGVHDLVSDRVGAVEVPTDFVKDLKPVAATAPPPEQQLPTAR